MTTLFGTINWLPVLCRQDDWFVLVFANVESSVPDAAVPGRSFAPPRFNRSLLSFCVLNDDYFFTEFVFD